MKGLFLDAAGDLAEVFRAMRRDGDPAIGMTIQAQWAPDDLPATLQRYDFILDDHTALVAGAMRACTGLVNTVRGAMVEEAALRSSPMTRAALTRARDRACRIASGELAGPLPLGGPGGSCAKIVPCVGVAEW